MQLNEVARNLFLHKSRTPLGFRKGLCTLGRIGPHSPMSNVQAVYLITVDPHPQEDIRAFSVVVLTSEPGSWAHYCSIPKGPLTLIEYNPRN